MDVELKHVEFGYSDTLVLDGIDLKIRGSQFVSIVGPNGVGKSTLIHCINKILEPTGGSVLVDGKDASEYSLKDMAKLVGYVPYKSDGTFPLTVVDLVLLGRNPHSKWKTSEEDLQIVYETLKRLDIEDLAMRRITELSAGQRQRVMLARGLVQKPKVILLDEPTSNLDIKHQMGISRLLRELSRSEDLMVIVISHDLNIAAKYSDNVVLMFEGKVFDVGAPEKVLTEDNIEKVYDVRCRVVDDRGSPLVILDDPENDFKKVPETSTCSI